MQVEALRVGDRFRLTKEKARYRTSVYGWSATTPQVEMPSGVDLEFTVMERQSDQVQVFRPRGTMKERLSVLRRKTSILNQDAECDLLDEVPPTPRGSYTRLDIGDTLSKGLRYAIGGDPELFAIGARGRAIPAWEFLPSKTLVGRNDHFPYWDGVQMEATLLPAVCHESLWMNTYAFIQNAHRKLPKGARLAAVDVVDIPESLLQGASADHITLGCAASLNVYGDTQLLPLDGRELPIRFAGCHIHYGTGPVAPNKVEAAIKNMDRLYGVLSVSLLDGLSDTRRRQFYGRAGEYRLPQHGIEYRVPSAATLRHPVIWYLSHDLARFALMQGIFGGGRVMFPSVPEDEIRRIINDLDVEAARAAMREDKKAVLWVIGQLYTDLSPSYRAHVVRLLMEGAKAHLALDGELMATWTDPRLRGGMASGSTVQRFAGQGVAV
jgi:hypothetical protein